MSKWVLLVEDDKDIQESLLDLLELEGYAARGAFDGQEALDLLRQCHELPSLILLDLMMRGMSGKEFREAQLADPRLKHIPVVIMSADGRPADHQVKQHADGYLRKPADVDEILQVVSQYLGAPVRS